MTTAPAARRPRGLRQLAESMVLLALAVILLRSFELEGYVISTGSMAPYLLGHHHRVVCPSCGYVFAFGVEGDAHATTIGPIERIEGSDEKQPLTAAKRVLVRCPNCTLDSIDISRVRPIEGDQLLVLKNVFDFRAPHRWETVVFRSPHKPLQPYVKRIVGLPGEEILLRDGDVYVNGSRVRKNLADQRSLRILVYDDAYRPPAEPDWQPRWLPESTARHWKRTAAGFHFDGLAALAEASQPHTEWLVYRHWIRHGGWHRTSVPLAAWPADLPLLEEPAFPIRYDAAGRRLVANGVVPPEAAARLKSRTRDEAFRWAVDRLVDESHLAPVTDYCGYNPVHGGVAPHVVRDLMLSATVNIERGLGKLVFWMTDGVQDVACTFDAGHGEIALHSGGHSVPIRQASLPDEFHGRPMLVEMSLFDRQVLIAVDGVPLFEPWPLEPLPEQPRPPAPRRPVRIGAEGLSVRVEQLRLYRDVYYTSGHGRHGVRQPYRVGPNGYFVLGDNSAYSFDSRGWPDPEVPKHLLVGKPLIVHLPSRPGRIRFGRFDAYIRVPDLSRIRYIR